jgi:hypothetical protein
VATVTKGADTFRGAVKNLSLRGVFLETDQKLLPGDAVEITIALNDDPENGVVVDAVVARTVGDGVAFKFDKIDFDSYMHLKNLITLNMGDDSTVNEEMEAFLMDNAQQ